MKHHVAIRRLGALNQYFNCINMHFESCQYIFFIKSSFCTSTKLLIYFFFLDFLQITNVAVMQTILSVTNYRFSWAVYMNNYHQTLLIDVTHGSTIIFSTRAIQLCVCSSKQCEMSVTLFVRFFFFFTYLHKITRMYRRVTYLPN